MPGRYRHPCCAAFQRSRWTMVRAIRNVRWFDGLLFTLWLVLLLSVSTTELHAQPGPGAAAVEGTVLDPDGRAVVNAAVVVRNDATGYTRALVTDATGHFVALALPVGVYSLEASAPGFATERREGLQLSVGHTEDIGLKLTVAAVSEQVTVA